MQETGKLSAKMALLHLPISFDDYRELVPKGMVATVEGEWACFVVKVLSEPKMIKGGKPRFAMDVSDGRTRMILSDFGALKFSPFKDAKVGEWIAIRAIPKQFGSAWYLSRPEIIPEEAKGKLVPRYQARKGVVSAARLRQLCGQALETPALEEAADLIRKAFHGLSDREIGAALGRPNFSLTGLLKTIHAPAEVKHSEFAVGIAKRMAAQSIIHMARAAANKTVSLKSAITIDASLLASLVGVMPFPLTGAQSNAVQQIADGLREPYAMNMLLSGDVGTGKTATYLLPAAVAQKAGAKVGIMIPNLVLARQIEAELKSWFPDLPTIFVGGDSNKIAPGALDDNPIVLGTTAMLHQLPKHGWVPDFLVVDEQQKTSVEQRLRLVAPHTNLLEATATCMPRTKALVEHGAIDVVVLNEFPVKKTIHTAIVDPTGKAKMFNHLKETVDSGGQIAIIYPLVEDKEDEESRKSVESAAQMWDKIYPGKVAMLHGRLTDEEKLAALASMKSGEKRVLVASTVVEIGVTIPALRAVMVVHAERYGVSTLHQIRGRVARHGGEGWCYLYLPEPVSDESMARLGLLEQFTDGFKLAEADMNLRGFGDLSDAGETQHGASRAIFYGIDLMPEDVQREMALQDEAAKARLAA